MSSTSINQGTCDRVVNRNRRLNDGWCSDGVELIKMENSPLHDWLHDVLGSLGIILYEMLYAPTEMQELFKQWQG